MIDNRQNYAKTKRKSRILQLTQKKSINIS